ncbi:MAG: glycosyltransferase [Planctomycetes bacterium]|nr:glycosyltransferase [Planctomycetota bacterium]
MKIAFICDWLTGMRGGEKCLLAMCEVYPNADIYTLVHYPENFSGEFEKHRITTSFIQKLPGNGRTFRHWLPLFPKAVESFDLSGYDLVLSFSHCVAKGVKVPAGVPHICYCHTPMRYAWDMRQSYLSGMNPLKKRVVSLLLDSLKKWDRSTASRVDHFIANSRYVQQRIEDCYGRDSKVIYPPVDIEQFSVSSRHDDYYLILSAMVPYKRIDLAIQAFNQNGKRLIAAGGGPDYNRLKEMAEPNIEFVLDPDDAMVEHLYAGCRALIFPGEEDFGIVPLEAQACGKPVIAYGKGGALETVIGLDDPDTAPTGVFFHHQTATDLQAAIDCFEDNTAVFIPQNCRQNSERFNQTRYKSEMTEFIQNIMAY